MSPFPLLPGREHRNATVAVYVRDAGMAGWSPDRLRDALYAEMPDRHRDRVFGEWQPEGWVPASPMDRLRRSLKAGDNVFPLKAGGGGGD